MAEDKLIMFPDNNNNGNFTNGWGGGLIGFILGILFGNNGFFGGNGFGGNNGTGYIANQMNNDSTRDLIMQALNGTDADVRLLATTLNSDINSVKDALNTINNGILQTGAANNMNYMQTINSIQSGNASLSRQLCECCCENRLLTTEQGYQSQIRTLEQTNQLGSQADRNTNTIVGAIKDQSTMITKEFCDVKERELQNKIDSLIAQNTRLENNINNAQQTAQIAQMLAPMQAEIQAIKAAQPATITLPNTQYQVVPALYAQAGADFIASYWANRLGNFVSNNNSSTTTNS